MAQTASQERLISVTVQLRVTDARALHRHAVAKATRGPGGLDRNEAISALGCEDKPNVGECLRWCIDPGTSMPGAEVIDSQAE